MKKPIKIRKVVELVIMSIMLCQASKDLLIADCMQQSMNDSANDFSDDIDEYDKFIEEYAEDINEMNLSDLEVIMKVINDQWAEYGYNYTDSIIGYERVSIQKDKEGVCRGFADDFTARMNAINKDYNARNMVCYLDESEMYGMKFMNIPVKDNREQTPVVDDNTSTVDDNVVNTETSNTNNAINIYINQILSNISRQRDKSLIDTYGNHMLSVINIPGKDYLLVVDSLNQFIGVIDHGDIYVFNDNNEKGVVTYKLEGNFIRNSKNYLSPQEFNYDVEESLEELEKQYGYDAQIKALENVKEKVYKKN